jgi:hypothetical protein
MDYPTITRRKFHPATLSVQICTDPYPNLKDQIEINNPI